MARWNPNKPSNRKTFPWSRRLPWSRKKISFKRLPSTVARKRCEWVSLYNDTGSVNAANQGCTIRCIEIESNCNDASTRIAIMPQGAVEALYDDDITIAAVRGFIMMKPKWILPNGCDATNWINRMAGETWPIYLRAGVYKQELVEADAGVPPFVDVLNENDWTDVRSLKKWNHVWMPKGRHRVSWQQPDKIIGVCSDVSRSSYNVPATSSGSQPLYTVPEIDTTCTTVKVGSGEGACNVDQLSFEREEHAWYRMPIILRKPIRMRENDSLDIFLNWSIPRVGSDCELFCGQVQDGANPCAMMFSIQMAAKIQFG